MEGRSYENFQEVVNTALILEKCRGIMDRKRKERQDKAGGGSSKQARFGSSSNGQTFCNGQQQQQRVAQPYQQHPRYQQQQQRYQQQQPRNGQQSAPVTAPNFNANQAPSNNRVRYNCGEKGHFANNCPQPRQNSNKTPR